MDVLTSPLEPFLHDLEQALAGPGYGVFPGLLRPEFVSTVRIEMNELRQANRFHPAGIGRGDRNRLETETRGDGIYWWEPTALTAPQSKLGDLFTAIRERLNRGLFLGLWDFEGHYAVYPAGAFYRKHLDRFSDDSRRTVSIVLFFNSEWEPADGGSLRLETAAGEIEVEPVSGTAVFFLSERIPHEVLETTRDRLSFAGWFRTRHKLPP